MLTVKDFLHEDSGAVTVDFVVLTAGIVGIGIAVVGVASGGLNTVANGIADALGEPITSVGRFDLNRLANASFENIEDFVSVENGGALFLINPVDGSLTEWDNIDGRRAELKESGFNGVQATDGSFFLDLEASPGNVAFGQQIQGAVTGQTYTMSFDAADIAGNNGVEVVFGGEVVGTFTDLGTSMAPISLELTGGAGNGDNTFVIRGLGPADNVGAYIDNVQVRS